MCLHDLFLLCKDLLTCALTGGDAGHRTHEETPYMAREEASVRWLASGEGESLHVWAASGFFLLSFCCLPERLEDDQSALRENVVLIVRLLPNLG